MGGGADAPDASVRDLPGDGLEPTPDFDIDSRQRNPIGPEQVTERIDRLQNPGERDASAGGSDAVGSDSGSGDSGNVAGGNGAGGNGSGGAGAVSDAGTANGAN